MAKFRATPLCVAAALIYNVLQTAASSVSSSSEFPSIPTSTSANAKSAMPSSKMPSLRNVAKLALGSAVQVALIPSYQPVIAGTPVSCPDPELSCQTSLDSSSSCCLNAPGGQLLLTQFWDTNPSTGPVDSWTIHGLWPDKCDGTYEANCDPSRDHANIHEILSSFGADKLLATMDTYWKDYQGNDESLQSHEWNKHGQCISTLSPSCYVDYTPNQEVLDFFNITVSVFQTLPTYEILAAAGIVPSSTRTYTSAAIQAALKQAHGYEVTIGCRNGAFDQVWYHYNVKGSVQTGEFVPTAPDGTKSTCPVMGVRYLPKSRTG